MGNYLNTPNSTKVCENGKLGNITYAVCAMQGWRLTMEDAHVVHFFEYLPAPVDSPCVFFGVYDGHGGTQVAHYVARHIVEEFLKAFEANKGVLDVAFRVAYISLDSLLNQESQQAELEYFAHPEVGPCPFKSPPSQTPAMKLPKKLYSNSRINSQKFYRKVRRRQNKTDSPEVKQSQIKQQPDLGQVSTASSEGFYATVSDELPFHASTNLKNTKLQKRHLHPCMNVAKEEPSSNFENQSSSSLSQILRTIMSSIVTRTVGSTNRNQSLSTKGLAMLSGCTALSVLVTKSQVVVANAGDSRAVLCRGSLATELSKDHKPTLVEEKARIYTAGGWIEMGRINGNLNLSRALGDLVYKMNYNLGPEKQIVSPVPDIVFTDIQDDDEFLIVGCDGIWESCSSQEIIDFVRARLAVATKLSDVLEALFEELLSPNPTLFEYGCDNMTAILVDLRLDNLKAAKVTIGSANVHKEDLPT